MVQQEIGKYQGDKRHISQCVSMYNGITSDEFIVNEIKKSLYIDNKPFYVSSVQEDAVARFFRVKGYHARSIKSLNKDDDHYIDLVLGDIHVVNNCSQFLFDLKVSSNPRFKFATIGRRSIENFEGDYLLLSRDCDVMYIVPSGLIRYLVNNGDIRYIGSDIADQYIRSWELSNYLDPYIYEGYVGVVK